MLQLNPGSVLQRKLWLIKEFNSKIRQRKRKNGNSNKDYLHWSGNEFFSNFFDTVETET